MKPAAQSPPMNPKRGIVAALGLLGWLGLTFLAPWSGMNAGMPGEWYDSLLKPSWNPPAWIFAPVWTLLYTLMAVAAWLVWRRGGWRAQWQPLGWYLVQLILNAAWTPLFFGLRRPGWALVEIVLLLAAVAVTTGRFMRADRGAGLLFLPYLAWTAFATVLNAAVWAMNRPL